MNKRLYLLFGISIAFVVLNHSIFWCITSSNAWHGQVSTAYIPGTTPMAAWLYYLLIVVKKMATFAVPAFLFASGYFAAFSGRKTSAGGPGFKIILNRVLALAIPYAVWSVIIFLVNPLNDDVSILKLIPRLLYGGVIPGYFFVPLLIQFTILAPFMVSWARDHSRALLIVTAVLQLVVMALSYVSLFVPLPYVQHFFEVTRTWSIFPTWAFYYALGMVAGFHPADFQQFITRYKIWFTAGTLVFAVLAVTESVWLTGLLGNNGGDNQVLMASSLFSLCFICAFLTGNFSSSPISKPFSYLSNKTFGIYLVHILVVSTLPLLVGAYLPFLRDLPLLFLLLLLAAGFGVPLLLMFLTRKLVGQQVYKYLFG